MTRKETIDLIEGLNQTLEKMSDEDLYNYMMENSPSFRKTIENLDKYLEEVM